MVFFKDWPFRFTLRLHLDLLRDWLSLPQLFAVVSEDSSLQRLSIVLIDAELSLGSQNLRFHFIRQVLVYLLDDLFYLRMCPGAIDQRRWDGLLVRTTFDMMLTRLSFFPPMLYEGRGCTQQ